MSEIERREDILAKLSYEAPVFAGYRERVERSGGLDAELNHKKAASLGYIDRLLDRLNVIDLESIPTLEDPDKHQIIEMPLNIEVGQE